MRGEFRRANQVGEQDRDLPTLRGVRDLRLHLSQRFGWRWRRHHRLADGREDFPPMAERNTHLLEVLVSQMGEYRDANFIFGKTPRVLPKSQLPKPICNLLHGASGLIGLSGGIGGVDSLSVS